MHRAYLCQKVGSGACAVPDPSFSAVRFRGERLFRYITALFDRRFSKKRVGVYRLGNVLGQGRFATCFSASQAGREGVLVVKKVSPRKGAIDIDAVWAECAALSALDHSGIPRWCGVVNEKGSLGSFYGIVETRCSGISLEKHLATRRAFGRQEIHDIGLQLIDIVAHAASRGVVHGDIRPANVVLAQDGSVSLIDFGLARFFDRALASRARFAVAAADVEGIVEIVLYLLYSNPSYVMSRGKGESWQEQLLLTAPQRAFLSDGFFNRESFASFEHFIARFDEAFLPDE